MLNGEFVDINQPLISIEDRGYQFGDGVYEVVPVMSGRLIGFDYHLERLDRSLREMQIPAVYTHEEMYDFHVQIMEKGNIYDGLIYFQFTRGVAPRQHNFPDKTVPVLTMVGRQKGYEKVEKQREEGTKVISLPDIRWHRCDVKTINLLGNVLAKQKAYEAKVDDALQYRENGDVTECASSNFMVVKDGVIWSHPDNNLILPGCTKRIIFKDLCPNLNIPIVEKAFNLEFAKKADEAFSTSSSTCAMPIVKIDKDVIGDGKPGEVTRKLNEEFKKYIMAQKVILNK